MKNENERPTKRVLAAGLAVLIALALAGPVAAGPDVGDPAPNFTLRDISGTAHSLNSYFGRVIILGFFSET